MQKSWKSAEQETSLAKADALEHAIDVLQTVEELLASHEDVMQTRRTVHSLNVNRDRYLQIAGENARPVTQLVAQS